MRIILNSLEEDLKQVGLSRMVESTHHELDGATDQQISALWAHFMGTTTRMPGTWTPDDPNGDPMQQALKLLRHKFGDDKLMKIFPVFDQHGRPTRKMKQEAAAPGADPKNKPQLIKLLQAAGLKPEDYEISGGGNSMSVELKDEKTYKKVRGKLSWGGYRTGYGAWVLSPNYTSKGDFNDPSSAWHY